MESRTTPIEDLNNIECFKVLETRKSGVFKDKKRHNAYFDDRQALHLVNTYIQKFKKSPTKTTDIQEMILDLSGYVKPIAMDTTPTPTLKVDKYVTDFFGDARKFIKKNGKTPTLDEIKQKVAIDVKEKDLRTLVLARVQDIPTILNPVTPPTPTPKAEIEKAPF